MAVNSLTGKAVIVFSCLPPAGAIPMDRSPSLAPAATIGVVQSMIVSALTAWASSVAMPTRAATTRRAGVVFGVSQNKVWLFM